MSYASSNTIKDISGHHLIIGQSGGISIDGGSVTATGVDISGEIIRTDFATTTLKSLADVTCTGESGGTQLSSNFTVEGIHLKALSGNTGILRVGPSNELATGAGNPSAVRGYPLGPNESLFLPHVRNLNQVNVFANVSGDKIATLSERKA